MNQFTQLGQAHMPYRAPAAAGEIGFFCCVKNGAGAWKLRRWWENSLQEVRTGLPEDWNECCPVADFDEGAFTLSFIAGPADASGRCGLYKFANLEDDEVVRLCDADVGFARQGWLVHGSRRGPLIVRRGGVERELHIAGLVFLYRACPDAFAPSRLLITATLKGRGDDSSIAYDFHDGDCRVVTGERGCLYKFAAHEGGGYVYAERGEGDFEDRRIALAEPGTFRSERAPNLVTLKDREQADGMDCVACFRKHVAAALSFAKEIMAGHGEGAELDHRADLEGEIANAEQHAREMTTPGYAPALRRLRHELEAKAWQPEAQDAALLRRLWKSSMGARCGCRKHRGEARG